ncbi:hypothetical protein [Massilia aerilata]|uniref:Type IV secretion system protein n=1 Tax=Massilia aerilata TaxID=453817 RepID=A0ABW0RZJ1_9BURK
MNFLKFITVAFLLALMTLQGANAAETPAETTAPVVAGSFFDKMDGAVREVGRKAGRELGETLATSGYSIAATVTTTALGIAGALAVVYLFYEVLQFLSGRTTSMLQVLFDVGIPCIFAAAFISQYAMLLPKFEKLLDVFRHLGSGGQDPFNAILDVYTVVIGKVTSAVGTAFKDMGKAFSFSKMLTVSPNFMLALVDLIATVFFALAVLVLLLIGVAEVLGLLLIGPFLFAVGVAFGPIMIAGLVTPWTRDYFSKWLQFIVISAGLTGVINVIFIIAAGLMKSVGVAQNTNEPTAVGLVIMAILMLTINSMVSQAPSIASALFPGHVGVSKSSGGAVVAAGKKAAEGTKNLGKGTRGTANGLVGAGQKAFRFAKSRMGSK